MQASITKAMRRAAMRGYDPYNMADAAGTEFNRMRRRSGWIMIPRESLRKCEERRGVIR